MPRAKTDIAEKISRYEADNLRCARIIVADPDKYGGEQSLMVAWAREIISKSCK